MRHRGGRTGSVRPGWKASWHSPQEPDRVDLEAVAQALEARARELRRVAGQPAPDKDLDGVPGEERQDG